MKRWKKLAKHKRDIRNIQCDLMSIERPEDPNEGTVTEVKGLWHRSFPELWPRMKELGHTTCSFEGCDCSKEKTP